MRVLSVLFIVIAMMAHSTLANAQTNPSGTTTRIETQPIYGAVITYESGVRVFRPIPPTQHMIINPDAQTPVFLGIIGSVGGHGSGPGVMNQQGVVPGLPWRRGIQTIPAIPFPP